MTATSSLAAMAAAPAPAMTTMPSRVASPVCGSVAIAACEVTAAPLEACWDVADAPPLPSVGASVEEVPDAEPEPAAAPEPAACEHLL